MRNAILLTVACLALLLGGVSHACIWDTDTLAMERAKFPEVNELIAGHFARHSEVYYQWRLDTIGKIAAADRTPGHYDDLAAAHDKLGNPEKAVELILEKIERFPGQSAYESQANLGTFYIHAGQLEKGLVHIANAIAINPDAHFGREVYQKLLVQYVIQQRKAGYSMPLHIDDSKTREPREDDPPRSYGFDQFIFEKQGIPSDKKAEEIKRAIKGVLGMMRFGNYDSPILLEALGDLLEFNATHETGAPQRLAVRAYLKASYEVEDDDVKAAFRKKAKMAIGSQQGASLDSIERNLKKEIALGDAYFEKIQADEQAWVTAGKDLDAEFKRVYYDPPELKQSLTDRVRDAIGSNPMGNMIALALGVLVIILAAAVAAVVFFIVLPMRQKKQTAHS